MAVCGNAFAADVVSLSEHPQTKGCREDRDTQHNAEDDAGIVT